MRWAVGRGCGAGLAWRFISQCAALISSTHTAALRPCPLASIAYRPVAFSALFLFLLISLCSSLLSFFSFPSGQSQCIGNQVFEFDCAAILSLLRLHTVVWFNFCKVRFFTWSHRPVPCCASCPHQHIESSCVMCSPFLSKTKKPQKILTVRVCVTDALCWCGQEEVAADGEEHAGGDDYDLAMAIGKNSAAPLIDFDR